VIPGLLLPVRAPRGKLVQALPPVHLGSRLALLDLGKVPLLLDLGPLLVHQEQSYQELDLHGKRAHLRRGNGNLLLPKHHPGKDLAEETNVDVKFLTVRDVEPM
jgi:hypothetical protein